MIRNEHECQGNGKVGIGTFSTEHGTYGRMIGGFGVNKR